jgi:hypothetical protein
VNIRDWLAHREPSPPRELRERLEALVLEIPGDGDPAASLIAVAEVVLARLARDPSDDRATALDLLAVDALVTYAFEYASARPGEIPRLSAGAMSRLSAVAAP